MNTELWIERGPLYCAEFLYNLPVLQFYATAGGFEFLLQSLDVPFLLQLFRASAPSPLESHSCWSITLLWQTWRLQSPSCLPHIDLHCLSAHKSPPSLQVLWECMCALCLHTQQQLPSQRSPKRIPGLYLIRTHHTNLGVDWQVHFPHSACSSTAAIPMNNQAPRVVL